MRNKQDTKVDVTKQACPFGKAVSTRSDRLDRELFDKLVTFDDDIRELKEDIDNKFEDIADKSAKRDDKMRYIFWMGIGALVLGVAKLVQGTII